MKLAFIILAHKAPSQVARLLQKLAHPNVDCYLHIDAKSDLTTWKEVLSLPNVFPVHPRANVIWAGWGIVQATLNGMQAVMDSGRQYSWVTLLSGQDYVLRPLPEIFDFLSRQNGRQFLNVIPDAALQPKLSKMLDYHFVEYNFPGKYKLGSLLTLVLPARKVPYDLKLYCGDAWWTLTQDCVKYVLRYEKEHPALRRYFKLSWGSDEFILPTILMQSQYKKQLTMDSLHYIDWSAGKEHPRTFGPGDVDALRDSGKLFARKFDMQVYPEVFELLDGKKVER